jgi:tyrosyl-tRNA synthetase
MVDMKLSEELAWRGFVAQYTFHNVGELDDQPRMFYIGADPSDSSLTIGNLAALMMARVFMRHGYTPIMLVGGGTGLIGDPKMDKERPLKPTEEIARNAQGITKQFQRIMGRDVKIVNNYDWLSGLGFFQFLNEVGQHFSMTQLNDRDFVKARTGQGGSGLSMAEFSYSLLQGYDFLHLYRNFGVTLQLCGADQWGNCISGVHLIKRVEGADVDVWSTPLVLNKATGRKFGKSEDGAVWLDAARTSPYQFYQFWLNVDDAGVIDYLKIYTELDRDQIDAIAREHSENPAARTAQREPAHEVTRLVHGANVADNVIRVTDVLFGGDNIGNLSDQALDILAAEIPTATVGDTVVEVLVKTGIASSNGEAMRLIRGGGVSANGVKITENTSIAELSLSKKGKNAFILVK